MFITMPDGREKLRAWQGDYNHCRPHGSLGHLTPSEFATMRSGQPREAAYLWFEPVRLPGERQDSFLGQDQVSARNAVNSKSKSRPLRPLAAARARWPADRQCAGGAQQRLEPARPELPHRRAHRAGVRPAAAAIADGPDGGNVPLRYRVVVRGP
ncbi:MAG: transposase [Ideonella sp.]|nr:transposase [Ideonella sp.]MCC7457769.1 transposase [Nitrospira sp.]